MYKVVRYSTLLLHTMRASSTASKNLFKESIMSIYLAAARLTDSAHDYKQRGLHTKQRSYHPTQSPRLAGFGQRSNIVLLLE